MNPFRSLRDYEAFVYTLKQNFASVERSTLVVIRRGRRIAVVQGEVTFAQGFRLTVKERLSVQAEGLLIESYGYELWRGADKLAWYDPQPHPEPALASTYPHHKHIPPDIKHNRVPAPGISFSQPNLPLLIGEIEDLLAAAEPETKP